MSSSPPPSGDAAPTSVSSSAGSVFSEFVSRELATRAILFHQAVAERLGLNVTDHRCADVAARACAEGPITAGRLAELTGLTTGAITGVLDRLEKAGFVRREKDETDRRQVLVRFLAERDGEYEEIFSPLAASFNAICARYTPAELERTMALFQEMSEVLGRETDRIRGARSGGSESSTSLGSIDRGRLEFTHGTSHVAVRTEDGPHLYRAAFDGPAPTITSRQGHVVVEFSRSLFRMFQRRKDHAEIWLQRQIPWDIVMRGGVSHVEGSLSAMWLKSLEISGGASDVRFALPPPRGTVTVLIGGGVSNVRLERPAGTPAKLHVSHGASDLAIDSMQLGAVGGDMRWETPDFGAAENRYDIRVSKGASRFTLAMSSAALAPAPPYR